MAQTELQPAAAGKTKRKAHPNLRIDMTPMVDLGFLLITFFIFTTTMTEKRSTELIMPKEGEPMLLGESKALTVVLGSDDQVVAYTGKWEDALQKNAVVHTNYNEYEGIGKIIRERQKSLQAQEGQKGRDDLMLLIKPTSEASYKNLMAALDETTINAIKKYAIVEPTPEEQNIFK